MNGYPPGAIWPAEDDNAEQIREVYARHGLAMYHAQVLEHAIVNAVVITCMLSTPRLNANRTQWENAIDAAYEREFTKTFGNMLKALESAKPPEDLIHCLRQAKNQRDRLAHRFFREHDQNILNRSGRTKMIIECEETIELFDMAEAKLEAFTAPQCERHGITPEAIKTYMEKLISTARDKNDRD